MKTIQSIFFIACMIWLSTASAQSAQSAQAESAASTALSQVAEDYLRTQTRGIPGKVSYHITPPDPRTRLAQCDAYEPFQPPGAPAWGKTTVGVRCLGPNFWTIYLQARVNVQSQYLVAARPLAAGQVVGPGDFIIRDGDLGTLPATVLMDSRQALGRTVRTGIAAGQVLRSDQLLAPWAVQQGQIVKTQWHGTGFSVTGEGRALNNAQEGQVVQVRTPSGQTVSGIARPGGIVEIR